MCLIMLLLCALSWLLTCGLVALICWLVGGTFTWAVATAVWIILIILKVLI